MEAESAEVEEDVKKWDFPVKKSFDCDTCQDTYYIKGESCQECCEHDFDPDEGYMCLNCGAQKDIGELIDEAEWRFGGDR